MRRSERAITEVTEIAKIIEKCDVCRLGLSDENVPYVVPLNFGYEHTDGQLILYFHGAATGKKHDIIAKNPLACFEMDCFHKLVEGAEACKYTMEFESVIGNGKIEACVEKSEKIHALRQVMRQYVSGKEFDFPDHALDATTVFRLVVSDVVGKQLKKG